MQIILEPLCFAYFDLVECFFQDKKLKKRNEYFLKIFCAVVSFVCVFLIILGAFWINDASPFKTYGTVMLIVGSSVLSIHVVLALFAGANRLSEEKRSEELLDNQSYEKNEPTPIIQYIETEDDNRNQS